MSGDLMYASVFLALALIVLVPSVLAVKLKPNRRRTRGLKDGMIQRPAGQARAAHQSPFGRRQS